MAGLSISCLQLMLLCALFVGTASKPSNVYHMTNELWDDGDIRKGDAKENEVLKNRQNGKNWKKDDDLDRVVARMSVHEQVIHLNKMVDRMHTSSFHDDNLLGSEQNPAWKFASLNPFDWAIFKSIAAKLRSIKLYLKCDVCKGVVMFLQNLVAKKYTKEEIRNIITQICIAGHIEDDRICRMVTREFQEEVLTVFDRLALSPDEACGLLVGSTCGSPVDPGHAWNVTLPKTPKPPVTPPKPPKKGAPVVRIVHVSDIHVDFLYHPGSNALCNEPLCCRKNNGPVVNGSKAGYWGDYHMCDSPTWLIETLFKHLKENETFDYIYWTGDLAGHNIWNQTRDDQIKVQVYLNALFLKYFPGKMILPSIGNHDSVPVNSFPPPFINDSNSMSWLYDVLAQNWSHWLPKDTMQTLKKGSYYTVLLKPGFRVVSLNTNYCNNDNWWLLLNETDPASELKWLIKVLQKAEDNHEKVHILGHMPTGHGGCLKYWSWNYHKIVNRYESTVSGMFFGHTHDDHYVVYYDEASKFTRPALIAYVGPSVTPYKYLNPGYRVYTVDGFYPKSSFTVLDHTNYIVNLTEANQSKNPPIWHLEYSAKKEYNLKNLFPADWSQLIEEFKKNGTLFNIYYQHFNKMSPEFKPCTGSCKTGSLCELKTARSDDPEQCKDLLTHDEYADHIVAQKLRAKC